MVNVRRASVKGTVSLSAAATRHHHPGVAPEQRLTPGRHLKDGQGASGHDRAARGTAGSVAPSRASGERRG